MHLDCEKIIFSPVIFRIGNIILKLDSIFVENRRIDLFG